MRCNHTHDVVVEPDEDRVALVYGETIVLGVMSFIGYDNHESGCFVLREIDRDAIDIIPDKDSKNIQIMIFDNFNISETIDKIKIYSNSVKVNLKDLEPDQIFQFSTTELKEENKSTEGMIRNPITGKWSFL